MIPIQIPLPNTIAYAFVELVKYLFTVPGTEIFLSRKICQDPLEKFFGTQRQIGGTHDNTTIHDFQKNTQALRVVNSFCRGTVKGNCRGNDDLQKMEGQDYSLPRRSKSKTIMETDSNPIEVVTGKVS